MSELPAVVIRTDSPAVRALIQEHSLPWLDGTRIVTHAHWPLIQAQVEAMAAAGESLVVSAFDVLQSRAAYDTRNG